MARRLVGVFGNLCSIWGRLQPRRVLAAGRRRIPRGSGGSVRVLLITSVVFYGLGAFAGRAADRAGPRIVAAAGAIVLGLGLCLTAIVDRVWLGYLTYGVGVGGACCYVPTLAVVGRWFERQRNMALGLAAAGTGAGTMAGNRADQGQRSRAASCRLT